MIPLNNRSLWVSSAFVIVGILIYSNTLEAPFHFDDLPNIRENPNIRLTALTVKSLSQAALESPAHNRPIANVSFALNYYLHQYNVAGYHVVNIIIHVLTGIFLYLFTKTTLCISGWKSTQCILPKQRQTFPNSSIPHSTNPSIISFFAALVWLVHPIHTQSVTYIVQRMNSMAAMFYVLSFLLYVRGRLVREKQKSWPWFAGCVVAGILALGSKEIAATLPFFILLYEWYFFQDLSRAWLKRHLPYMIGSLILFALLAFLYLGLNPLEAILSGYKHRDFTLTQRVLTEFRVVIHYISLLIYPHPFRLNLDHDFRLSHSLIDPVTTLLSMGAIIGLIGLAICVAKKQRLISFCILWFFGNLAIESSVIGLEIVFEHRTYIPSMFFFLVIIILVHRYVRKRLITTGILAATTVFLCVWTWDRNEVWCDSITLWNNCVQKSGKKARPHENLGKAFAREGKVEEAIFHLRRALEISPEAPRILVELAKAEARQRKFPEATAHYEAALRISPNYGEAHNGLGAALAEQGKLQEAFPHFLEALRLEPGNTEARYNAGFALFRQGKLDDAIACYREALRIEPEYAEAHNNLGIALARKGDLDQAVHHFYEALRIRRDFREARKNLKKALGILSKSR